MDWSSFTGGEKRAAWYDWINPFTDNKEVDYQRGRLMRGVGKGFLNAPGDLVGFGTGLARGTASLLSGDGFGSGFEQGYSAVSDPWRKFTRWASTPVREGYDEAHRNLLDDISREQGDNYARYVKDVGGAYENLGDTVGGLLGYGAAAKGVGAAAKATGLANAASKVAPVVAKAEKIPVVGKTIGAVARNPGRAVRTGAALAGTAEGAKEGWEYYSSVPGSTVADAVVHGVGSGLTTYSLPAMLTGKGFTPQMIAGQTIPFAYSKIKNSMDEKARNEYRSRLDELDRMHAESVRPGPLSDEYKRETKDRLIREMEKFRKDYGREYVPPVE